MFVELTAKQKAALVQELIQESSIEELGALACKLIRAYATFNGSDMSVIQICVDRHIKASNAAAKVADDSDLESEEF